MLKIYFNYYISILSNFVFNFIFGKIFKEISNFFLKMISSQLLLPLTILINNSMSNGTFPDALKVAKVIPIFKNQENYLFSNYRPISVLPSISKIYEKVIYK